ncbi:MAG: hypothetical protein C5S41_00285, partial [Candidatus Methanomarinus sp.]
PDQKKEVGGIEFDCFSCFNSGVEFNFIFLVQDLLSDVIGNLVTVHQPFSVYTTPQV